MVGDEHVNTVLRVLEGVVDPEVPVLNVVEMGIIHDVSVDGSRVSIDIAPTYSGCPAMRMIESNIQVALERAGYAPVNVRTLSHIAWSTDMLGPEAKRKLEEYGIAPPLPLDHPDADPDGSRRTTIACPFCKSRETSLTSFFGSTACKSLHYCRGCEQPFEAFKCI